MQNGKSPGFNYSNFTLNPVPKPNHQRLKPKKGERGKFTPNVREEIIERDNGLCIRCKRPAVHIHHVTYRSQLGIGAKRNGVCLCISCHEGAHKRAGREWCERWRETQLDENGNLKQLSDY
jgi:5-methylcytosine-specific restriction endonuclease McrA